MEHNRKSQAHHHSEHSNDVKSGRTDQAKHQHGNHDEHSGTGHHKMMIADFRKRFFVTLIMTIPVMLLSPMIQHWFHFNIAFKGAGMLLFILSTVVYTYGGFPFLKGLVSELRNKKPGMMTLVAVAISVAYIYSTAIAFGLVGMDFFWELCTLILIMLLGHWIEMRSVVGASRDLELLVELMPAEAHMVMPNMVHDVRTDSLKEGDIILIKPGERVAADGVIIEGESYLNESLLTGESVPVKKKAHDNVIAGAINGNGSLKVKVSYASKDSYLSRVIKLIEDAQKSKSKTQLLADKAAQVLTIVALVTGSITFLYWLFVAKETTAFALERMVTVIVICCPHALGLAVPLVVATSTSLSAKHGLLIKNRTAFENSRKISTVIFDKTGTLTVGKFEVVRVEVISNDSAPSDYDKNDIVRYAAALEQNSEHPIATGITAYAHARDIEIPDVTNFQSITGKGVEATVEGKNVKVVSPGFLTEKNISSPISTERSENETVVYIMIDDKLVGVIALADQIRKESFNAIKKLRDNDIKSILLTGDNSIVAKSVSDKLEMDGFFAEVLPHEKLEKVKELQLAGEFVAMTGDGVNDAPALAQADIGIAIGSGSDIAAETAGIILVNSNPKDVASLIIFGKATHKKMIQNLIWATGYNLIALPLAAGVLYSFGIMLSPATGAVLMTLSTVVVAINAKLLKI